ncbi:DUF1028 domain-containing protein [Nocardioides sp. LHD-245]|uniref:DUF1028 domain-containing protein n=1 Tax=Nocardioides sp. LHD-245 TaxID=3051387 RepID=UPI0027E0590F|nr:DUF1028 domain-containing protein [Nocardioides sp. LHD-245]
MSFIGADDQGFGIAIASSSPAVAARCAHLRSGVGVVASQNVTDPRLGPRLLDLLERHGDAEAALHRLTTVTELVEYRQLTVLGSDGGAFFSGGHVLGVHAAVRGDRVVGAGNLLAGEAVIAAGVAAFEDATGELEERLLSALLAALDRGGEAGPLHAAGLLVTRHGRAWNETDLRVDWSDGDPVAELGDLLRRWLPERDAYVARAIEPGRAPSYGVPGDL